MTTKQGQPQCLIKCDMVISVFKKFVAAVTTSVVCAGLIGCGDGVGQARDEALSQLDGMVWLEDPSTTKSKVEKATSKEQITEALSQAQAENDEREKTYWKCASRATEYVPGKWTLKSSTTDGMVLIDFHFDLISDGTVNFTKISQWPTTAGKQNLIPGAEWVATHEGKVTGWSGDLPEVISGKKTLKPASELYENVASCKVAFNLSLTTTEGVENVVGVLKLPDKQYKANLEIGNGIVLVQKKD